jgi:hypothetical protein
LFILECLGVENLGVCYAICHVLWTFGMFYDPLVCITGLLSVFRTFGWFLAIWYIFLVRVYCTKKNLATLDVNPLTIYVSNKLCHTYKCSYQVVWNFQKCFKM